MARWRRLQGGNAETKGPFFHPAFFQSLEKVRTGVHVAVVRRNGQAVAFFPYHRDSHGAGNPAAGLLSDFEGLIQEPGLMIDPPTLLAACGLTSWRFNHLLNNQPVFKTSHYALHESPFIELNDGFDGYQRNRRSNGSGVVRRTMQKMRKLSRDAGDVRLAIHSLSKAGSAGMNNGENASVLRQLIAWKSQQYQAAGLVDLFEFDWVPALLQELLSHNTHEFGGVLAALYAGDELVAALAGMRTATVLHPWFPAYSPQFAAYSPGRILFIELIRAAADAGITRIDLGRGEERYKNRFKTGTTFVAQGSVERSYVSHLMRKSCHLAYHWLRRSTFRAPLQIPGRMIKNASERAALK